MQFLVRRFIGMAILVANAAVAAPPAPVAIVSDATGTAYVMNSTRAVRVTMLSELQPGQVLQLEPGSRVVVAFLPGGSVFELAGAGRFRVGVGSIEPLDSKNPPRKRDTPPPTSHLAAKASGAARAVAA